DTDTSPKPKEKNQADGADDGLPSAPFLKPVAGVEANDHCNSALQHLIREQRLDISQRVRASEVHQTRQKTSCMHGLPSWESQRMYADRQFESNSFEIRTRALSEWRMASGSAIVCHYGTLAPKASALDHSAKLS
ncbi:hypothetical protein FOL47_003798, partial [Perkinsus chesapeaki]